jgi:hypothetical protein
MKLKNIAVGVTGLLKINPRELVIEPGYNIRRFDSANNEIDAELKAQIRAKGVQQALVTGSARQAIGKDLISQQRGLSSI